MRFPSTSAIRSAAANGPLRFGLPLGLLVVEYLFLSLLVDLPTSGPALRLASAARTLVPAGIGAGAAGWLITRGAAPSPTGDAALLPAWRPLPALVAHTVAFGATAWLAHVLLRPGAPPVTPGAFLALAACAAVAALLAFATAAPLRWTARFASVHLRAPLLAIAFGVLGWRVTAAAEGLWGVLRASTLWAVAALLRAARPDAVVLPDESVVGAGSFEVIIAPICSGVDGLGLVLLFQALWLSLARSRVRLPRALLLLPLGAAAALAANVLRIAALVLLGASGREELALGAFHSKLGWLLFIGIALATVLAAERSSWLGRIAAPPDDGVPHLTGAYLGPLMAALASALLTSLWASPALDALYGVRVAAAGLALVAVRRDLPRPALSFSLVPVLAAAAVCALWIPTAGGDGTTLRVELERLGPAVRAAWIAVRLAGACIVLPVAEELAFRGFLLPWLVARDFDSVSPRAWTLSAVALSSLAFGALHDDWMTGTLAGAAFAAVRLWRGRLGDAIVAHALSNAGVAAAVLLRGRWDLWK